PASFRTVHPPRIVDALPRRLPAFHHLLRPPRRSTLFPYTTLFRSRPRSVRPTRRTARVPQARGRRTRRAPGTSCRPPWPSSRERFAPHRARPRDGRRASCPPRGTQPGVASPTGPHSVREGGRNLPLRDPL